MLLTDKIAQNTFQATHIANGLRLWELKSEEEQRERYTLYREWRNAGEPSKVAYENAISGKKPLTLIEKENAEENTKSQTQID